jgi:hypothetical protein
VLVYSCRKSLIGGLSDDLNNKSFTIDEAREHIRALVRGDIAYDGKIPFKIMTTKDGVNANSAKPTTIKTNQKIFYPFWDRAITANYKNNVNYVEVPIALSSKRVRLYQFSQDKIKEKPDASVAAASFQRLVVYKKSNGKVGQRLLTYIPDKQYIRAHGYEVAANSLNNLSKDFFGYIEYKNWSGDVVSIIRIENGKAVRRYKPTKLTPNQTLEIANQKIAMNQQRNGSLGKEKLMATTTIYELQCVPEYEMECDGERNTKESLIEVDCKQVEVGEKCEVVPVIIEIPDDEGPCPYGNCDEDDDRCDDCNTGGGGDDNNIDKGEKKIIDNVQDSCIKAQLLNALSAKTTIRDMLNKEFGGNDFLDKDIIFQDVTTLADTIMGTTLGENESSFLISLNKNVLPQMSQEFILSTFYHEILHAYLNTKLTKDVSGKYIIIDHHQTMATNYISLMTGALKIAFPRIEDKDAWALSWGGLEKTSFYNTKLKPDQRKEIEAIMEKHKKSASEKLRHGTYCK